VADLADVSDVIMHWRSLTPAETTVAVSSLKGASASLRSRVADVDARILAEAAAFPAGPTPFADLVNWTVAESVARKLRGIFDQRDSTAQSFFYQSEIDALTSTGVAVGGSIPVGSFPELVDYPVY
jgi:hypothetical protein